MAAEFTVLRRAFIEEEFIALVGLMRAQSSVVLRYYGLDPEHADDLTDTVLRHICGTTIDPRWASANDQARMQYIRCCIRRRAIDRVRRESRSVYYDHDRWARVAAEDDGPEDLIHWSETLKCLGLPHWPRNGPPPAEALESLLAMASLSESEMLVVRGYLGGLSHLQIAEQCGREAGSAEARKRATSWSTTTLSRAIGKIRARVDQATRHTGGAR